MSELTLEDPVFIGRALYGFKTSNGYQVKTSKLRGIYTKGQQITLDTLNSRYIAIFTSDESRSFFISQLKSKGFQCDYLK